MRTIPCPIEEKPNCSRCRNKREDARYLLCMHCRENDKQKRANRKKQHLCRDCGAPAEKTRCARCKIQENATKRQRLTKRMEIASTNGMNTCMRCLNMKSFNEFGIRKSRVGSIRINKRCKECISKKIQWMMENPIYCALRKRHSEFLAQGCAQCQGEAHDVDHISRNNKTKNLSDYGFWAHRGHGNLEETLAIYEKELELCQPLCKICHRRKTAAENRKIPTTVKQIYMHRRCQRGSAYLVSRKIQIGKCELCKLAVTEINATLFDFDHLDPFKKTANVSKLTGCSIKRIENEIAKCRLLCNPCHSTHTTFQGENGLLPNSREWGSIGV